MVIFGAFVLALCFFIWLTRSRHLPAELLMIMMSGHIHDNDNGNNDDGQSGRVMF